ncbi:MAG: hypothetical protein FWH04_07650 [Oscillospiraceae bacterium]|nr:hypothetical protein [Oscillospiraceae bacterium]
MAKQKYVVTTKRMAAVAALLAFVLTFLAPLLPVEASSPFDSDIDFDMDMVDGCNHPCPTEGNGTGSSHCPPLCQSCVCCFSADTPKMMDANSFALAHARIAYSEQLHIENIMQCIFKPPRF